MNTELKLTKHMSVYTTDDSKAGDVKHVVVEPTTSQISHVVIEQGFIFTEDKVLPIEYIDHQDEDGSIHLNRSSDNLDLIDYEDHYYVNRYDREQVADALNQSPDAAVVPQSMYYYPPSPNHGVGAYYWGLPGAPLIDPVDEVKVRNVPEGSLVIEEGANVYSRDGDHVGDVHSVHVDAETDRITHFIISQGLIFQDYKLIPVFWVSDADDDGITVAVTTEEMKKLPKFEPETA